MSEVSPVSYERLLRLAHQRAIDGKGGLAASIAKMCLDSRADLTKQELELTFEILRELIDQVEIEIRRYIADYLAERTDVPDDLVDFLANDTINVAYPILVHSKQLTDDSLVELVMKHGQSHQLAIAERDGLSEIVTDALVAAGDNEVAIQLVKNYSARISRNSMEALVDRSEALEGLQAPLTRRRDLPEDLARRMYIWVGEALRQHIIQNFNIQDDLVNAAIAGAVEAGIADSDAVEDVHGDRLVKALHEEGKQGFLAAFSAVTGLNMATVNKIFDMTSLNTIAIACKSIDFSKQNFGLLLQQLLGSKFQQYSSAGLFEKALQYFERLESANAKAALDKWKTGPH
ncbi:DUF2336 domain-containing protein [Aestuariispira ectoiniformans]|uniref:DUF2336 domain-containing protein n=1 Tax=Aestuariispira ectoiniformans TaxID=2775080 RepID=UPI00223BB0F9|nr:DUF2336 domain-containing protein [Aestuariispira ectoiniformans]